MEARKPAGKMQKAACSWWPVASGKNRIDRACGVLLGSVEREADEVRFARHGVRLPKGGPMAASSSVSAKIPKELREQIDEIAKLEPRTPSNVVRLAIEQFVTQYTKLHPQSRADILEALEGVARGEVEPYARG